MAGYLRLCNAVHWLALMLWTAALISAAVAAMNVFPTLDAMPLTVEQYAAYPESEHPRLVASHVMEGVFYTVDLLQFAAAPLLLVTLLAQLVIFRLPWRRPSSLIRIACIAAATGLLAYHATALAPRMNRELRAFWSAAEAGRVEAAREHRAAFNTLHPTADIILRVDLLLLVAAVVATATALGPSTGSPRLETADLLNRRA